MEHDSRRQDEAESPIFEPEPVDRTKAPPWASSNGHAPNAPKLRSRKRLALFLFLATCCTTFLIGVSLRADVAFPHPAFFQAVWNMGLLNVLISGLSYAGPVMLILLSHEMGHYLQARRYGVPASLPYFIPMPFPPFGTMGAVIIQGAGVADRKALFDIAVTGPLAGLVVALPCVYFGLLNAEVRVVEPNPNTIIFGDPLILQWLITWIHGPLGQNEDVILNPLLFAGWVGIFITALNLIPIGQLDGGHILYTLVGKKSQLVATILLFGGIGFVIYTGYVAWVLMLGLLLLMGPGHPPTADDNVPLGRGRIVLGWLSLAFIIIGFTPMPITQGNEKEARADRPAAIQSAHQASGGRESPDQTQIETQSDSGTFGAQGYPAASEIAGDVPNGSRHALCRQNSRTGGQADQWHPNAVGIALILFEPLHEGRAIRVE
jgi:Zn-dependent protease